MKQGSGTSRIVVGAIFFVLLLGVQTISLAHAFEHDALSLGDRTCATCVSISQLTAVAVDTGEVPDLVAACPVRFSKAPTVATVVPSNTPNQRGPPPTS